MTIWNTIPNGLRLDQIQTGCVANQPFIAIIVGKIDLFQCVIMRTLARQSGPQMRRSIIVLSFAVKDKNEIFRRGRRPFKANGLLIIDRGAAFTR